jgi:hypothetical protein
VNEECAARASLTDHRRRSGRISARPRAADVDDARLADIFLDPDNAGSCSMTRRWTGRRDGSARERQQDGDERGNPEPSRSHPEEYGRFRKIERTDNFIVKSYHP